MDHLSFVFSLLLIVSVTTTTFGSAIKANNPNGEEREELRSGRYPKMLPKTKREIEALLSDAGLAHYPEMVPNRQELETLLRRSHQSNPGMENDAEAKLQGQKDLKDQDSEKSKRKVDPGTVIEGAELAIGVLKDVLGALADVSRKCAIGIENESGYTWQGATTYFYSGTADQNLPYSVPNGKAVVYGTRKTAGLVLRGSVGSLAYYIPSIDKTLAVMFSVPFDYNWYENWWNAKLYSGNSRANYDKYKDLYYDADPFKANGWHERDLGSGLKYRGSMSSSGTATLEIHVLRK